MTGRQLTPFEHILLGLICTAPSSGYDLKRIFAAMPMGIYQPSSGTLYPALRRLEQKGLIKAQAPSGQGGESARHRRVYEPTQTGRAAHLNWLCTPVERATVSRDLGLHLMRFVMMEHLLPPKEVLTFLQNLADTLAEFTAQLTQYSAAADLPGRHPHLALEHGIAIHRASLGWTEQTIAALSADPQPSAAVLPNLAVYRSSAGACGAAGPASAACSALAARPPHAGPQSQGTQTTTANTPRWSELHGAARPRRP